MKRSRSTRSRPSSSLLQTPGWTEAARHRLEALILKGSGQGLPVVFDFDNTLVCGDIGEATLAVLVKSGALNTAKIPATFFPKFIHPRRKLVTLEKCVDLTDYYEAFLEPTVRTDADPAPFANGYALAVDVMTGLRPSQIVEATQHAYQMSRPGEARLIEVTPGKTGYPAPYYYPEMVELLARLIQHKFDVWIVSASNVWSVRWMIVKALMPLLREYGAKLAIPPERVVGVSMLLADAQHRLFKDTLLVRESRPYAALAAGALRRFKLTSRLHFPVSIYSGKVSCIVDYIGRPAHLCVGDSPGDLPMMKFSENCLWVARLEKPDYQRAAIEALRTTRPSSWLVQPTLTKVSPGFLPAEEQVHSRLPFRSEPVKGSLALWRRCEPPGCW